MSTPPTDAGIPLLTEVIEGENTLMQLAAARTVAAPAPAPAGPPPAAAPAPVHAAPPITEPFKAGESDNPGKPVVDWSDEEWHRLERKIRERILLQLLGRIDNAIEQHVRDSLAEVLQTAIEDVAAELRRSLHLSMHDMISRAVSQEITRLQTTRK